MSGAIDPDLSLEELRQRLHEAEETLRAIRDGEADAVVMRAAGDNQVHPLGRNDESYRAIMEAMDLGAVALDGDDRVVYANTAMCGLLGCTLDALLSEGLPARLDASSQAVVRELLDGDRDEHRRRQFTLGQGPSARHLVVDIAPMPLAFDQGSVLTFTDVTDRVEAERSSESARIARAVIASASEAVVVCDPAGQVINANTAAQSLARGDPLGRRFDDAFPLTFPVASPIIHSDDLVAIALEGNAVQALEAHSALPGGPADLLVGAVPLRLTADTIGGCVVTLVDNSERKAIEQHQSLLLRELDHRVKNSLAMVMSIASRTGASAVDLADFRTRFNSRVQALAATHTLLAEASWSGLSLAAVIKRELAPFTTSAGPRLVLDGLQREVSPDVGIAFGMVIHELTTNAVKYGALSCESGIVSITASDGPGPLIEVVWTERGGPPVTPPVRQGFGQTLIARSLDRGNGGRALVEFDPAGVICRMSVPLSY